MQGYEQPHYTNVVMPFPPSAARPRANATGIYRRSFTLPRGWRGRRIVLGFGGVEGVLHLLLNGEPVGISKDARTPAEFDVTTLVRHGEPNELIAVVVRWSDASFVEDQDQWWQAGISREVYLRCDRIEDVFVRPRWTTTTATGFSPSTLSRTGRSRRRSSTRGVGPVLAGDLPAGVEVRAPRQWSAESPALYSSS